MNEIVKYENQMNLVPLRNFNAVDLDFLMLLCHKFRDNGTQSIKFSLTEIKELAHYKFTGQDRFISDLISMNEKLLQCNFRYEDENKVIQFLLFTTFEIDKNKQTLEVCVNNRYSFLLNSLEKNFTRFELQEFVNLNSSYSKECYRRLKQFRTTGLWKVQISEFRRLLDIPESYRICDIDAKVLTPIQKELSPLFKDFKVQKIKKKGRGRGGVVDSLYFSFKPEKPNNQPISSSINKNASEGQIEPNTAQIDYKYSKEQVQKALNKLENGN